MKRLLVVAFGFLAILGQVSVSWGEETAAIPQEQSVVAPAASEAPAAVTAEATPAIGDVQNVIASYVKEQSDEMGVYDIYDPQTQDTRELSLVKIFDQVGKTGDNYFACGEFTDKYSGEKLDLDFDLEPIDGKLSVMDVKIHKVNDSPRFTYDEKGNRMAVETPEDEAAEAASEGDTMSSLQGD